MADPVLPAFSFVGGPSDNTATPAGQNQTIDQQGQVFDPTTQFYDPTKYGQARDSRYVPGMARAVIGADDSPGNTNIESTFRSQVPAVLNAPQVRHGARGPAPALMGDPAAAPENTITSTGTTLAYAMNHLLEIGQSADPTSIADLQTRLVKAGYLDPTKKGFNLGSISGTNDPTYGAYYQLLTGAIRTGTDVWAILQDRQDRDAGAKYEKALALQQEKADTAQKLADRQAAAQARALLPSQVSRSATDISDPLTAQGLLTPVLTNALGRPPTTQDISNFTSALQTAQAASPTLTTGTASPAVDGGGDKTTTTTGGFDKSQFTADYVNQHYGKEASAVGETTDFYNAALQALSSSGGR